jgi:hypothetical protein
VWHRCWTIGYETQDEYAHTRRFAEPGDINMATYSLRRYLQPGDKAKSAESSK